MAEVSVYDYAARGAVKMRQHPEWFFQEILGVPQEYLWPKMLEVMHSVRDHQYTAVKAGHSVSKSFTAARLALWFLICYGPKATVITTAPGDNQVRNILWREIRDAHSSAKCALPGKPLTISYELDDKWFAIGFATRPDTVTQQATAFQGFHNEHVLIIFDEAAGIMPQIWEASEGLMTSGDCRFLAIGNPTSAFGKFVDCFAPDSQYNQITISVLDTPNYKEGREVIPGLSGQAYERSMRNKYGPRSNTYRARVLGEIPEVVEGAIFGKELAACRKGGQFMDSLPNDKTGLVHTAWDLGVSDATAIWFFRCVGPEIHLLDYYEACGEGLTHYIEMLHRKRDEQGWLYGRHFAPHDIMVRELSTGNTRLDTARNLGINFEVLEQMSLGEGIESARQTFPRCWFDRVKCRDGLKSLSEYHWKKIETVSTDDRPVYSLNPVHNWASHGADAFRYLSVAYKHGLVNVGSGGDDMADWRSFYRKSG